jgi:hypothetical protein
LECTSRNIIIPLLFALIEYLVFGGYPEIALESDNEEKILLLKEIKNTFLNNYLSKAEAHQSNGAWPCRSPVIRLRRRAEIRRGGRFTRHFPRERRNVPFLVTDIEI